MLAALSRDRLTRAAHNIYMQDMNYYKVLFSSCFTLSNDSKDNLTSLYCFRIKSFLICCEQQTFSGTNPLENIDQLIADDIGVLSRSITEVYSNVFKPVCDLVIFTLKLSYSVGVIGFFIFFNSLFVLDVIGLNCFLLVPFGMYVYFAFASLVSTLVIPPYAKLSLIKQEKEGKSRSYEKRIINNAEMIAFVGGEVPEKMLLHRAFRDVFFHVTSTAKKKLFSDIVMGYTNKYAASFVAFLLLCAPWFFGQRKDTNAEIISIYLKSVQLLEGLADASMRLFDVIQDFGRLSGITSRVYNLFYTLHNIEKLPLPTSKTYPPTFDVGEHIAFRHVSIFKPDGRILVKVLFFHCISSSFSPPCCF